MKALVLAAGHGTRLLPHSQIIPKPLFPVYDRPIIDIVITRLIDAGVTAVAVNTHHLAKQVESFLRSRDYGIDLLIKYEPSLLGTGGALGNFSDFLSDGPFIVINSDILTDVHAGEILASHKQHPHPVTLVMHHHPLFNKVSVCPDAFVHGFSGMEARNHRLLAFTGIHVIDPYIFRFIELGAQRCIIDVYREMLKNGEKIKALVLPDLAWNDLGTPERFQDAVADKMIPKVLAGAFGASSGRLSGNNTSFTKTKLAGDGSQRKWYRISQGEKSIVMADHGITTQETTAQVDAFVSIGSHLRKKNIPVPIIFDFDRFSGLVLLQDLGDALFQDLVSGLTNPDEIRRHYKAIVGLLVKMSVFGKTGFDPDWAYEGAVYDKEVIVGKECLYFTERFLEQYMGISDLPMPALSREFEILADSVLKYGCTGFMHRDFQSRNIMVSDGRYFFNDFQGGRLGPLQYDLASILVDPYVNIPSDIQAELVHYAAERLAGHLDPVPLDKECFFKGYRYACISRLMQAIGAYAFLSRVMGKKWFEGYIPTALGRLARHLNDLSDERLYTLTEIVSTAESRLLAEKRATAGSGENKGKTL